MGRIVEKSEIADIMFFTCMSILKILHAINVKALQQVCKRHMFSSSKSVAITVNCQSHATSQQCTAMQLQVSESQTAVKAAMNASHSTISCLSGMVPPMIRSVCNHLTDAGSRVQQPERAVVLKPQHHLNRLQ